MFLTIFGKVESFHLPREKLPSYPLPSHEKNSKDPNDYRPIALTSCVCKTMERMINDCLVWFLEYSSLITEAQNGFRKTRSTMADFKYGVNTDVNIGVSVSRGGNTLFEVMGIC